VIEGITATEQLQVIFVTLSELLRTDVASGGKSVRDALANFTCERNGVVIEDAVDFIRNKAIPFEVNHVCRTFLAVSERDLSVG